MKTVPVLIRRVSLAMLACVLVLAFVAVAPALASPWWHIDSETVPTNLSPGGKGQLLVVFSNLGDQPIDGATEPVLIGNELSSGLVATGILGPTTNNTPVECTLATLQCSFKGVLYPYEQISITLGVEAKSAAGTLSDEASVQGGGAAKVARTLQVQVSAEPASFGVAGYELAPFNEDGTPATQAGAHPFQLTTTLVFNQAVPPEGARQPVQAPKDLSFHLPAGLVGNPTAVAQCTMANFFATVLETNLCPPASVVGVATVTADEPLTLKVFTRTVPVFNLVPSEGEPARFGLEVAGRIPVVIDTSVRSGQDYGVQVSVEDTTETAGLLSSQVTFWGVPGDSRHDDARGWECVAGEFYARKIGKPCPVSSELPQAPLLTSPGSCAVSPQAEPVLFSVETDSWSEPGRFLGAEYEWMSEAQQPLGFEGCGTLQFQPTIDVTPEQHTASTPTGLAVDVRLPQQGTLGAGERAEAEVRDTTVTLPEGVQLSPSAANGLAACPERPEAGYEGIGFTGFEKFNGPGEEPGAQTATFTPTFRFGQEEVEGNTLPPSCPPASKVGVVHIRTPLLSHELEGSVYLASPAPNGEPERNPFNALVALYIVAEDPVSGVLVKLAGEGHIEAGTLQISTTFENAPQVPFEELRLELFGGPRASLSTPPQCGAYTTDALFTPWSSSEAVSMLSPAEHFTVSAGAGDTGCPSGTLAFSPGFTAYSHNTQAGAFTGFSLELTRPDGDQALSTVSMHLPKGVAALLSSVELCTEAQAAAMACPVGSEIGEATAVAGLGPEPYVQHGGKVYITGPYDGAPFGLDIVTPADAGPFNLGYISVRSKLQINPENASVTIASDPLPTEIRGIPLQLKRVLVDVNRSGFEFNPTSCNPMSIEGTVGGAEGASAGVSSPFQVGGCQGLPFAPALTAATGGHASKADGTDFVVKVSSGGMNGQGVAQAGIAKVDLQLPATLPARLSTLQQACTERAFNANPASCPEGSDIGAATIHTPVLKNPLTGPAYLVSHGNAAFPDVEFVLQGEGITLVLDGKTQIKNGVTYSKFESAPDAPFTIFETVLPAGPHSALTANVPAKDDYSLCGQSLSMPTTITGQNGKVIEHDTKIAVQGCAAVKAAKAKKLTNAQKLAKALASCRHKYKHARAKRASCERQARRRYPLHKSAHKAKKHARKQAGKGARER